jgi:3-hydroxybutyrate dehydrogenase
MRHTALVTGSTQGIGYAIAQELARAGHDIVLHGIEPQAAGNDAATTLAAATGVKTAYIQADLSRQDEAENLFAQASAALATPDIVVNNAGIQHTSPIEEFSSERYNAVIAINLSSAFYAMRAAIPSMRERGWGRIVNVASVHGLVGSVNKSAYLASKHGLVGMSKGVALETAAHGITVNCICPGWTDTPLIQPQIDARAQQLGGDRTAGIHALLREKQPNLTLIAPSQLGQVAVFLCSDAASNITGVALPVDGGWTAQ